MVKKGTPRLPVKKAEKQAHPADRFKPIDLRANFGKLVKDCQLRICKVFDKYGELPTPEGWEGLALALMLEHEPAMKITDGQIVDDPQSHELVGLSLESYEGRSVYSTAKRLYGKRANAMRTAHSRAKALRRKRVETGLPQHPRGFFHMAVMMAVSRIEKESGVTESPIAL